MHSSPDPKHPKTPYVVAGHEALFERKAEGPSSSDTAELCDACGEPVPPPSAEDDGYAMSGRGRYLWSRGGERRAEEPPLCPSCAAAIGMVALNQWNIEEEEG